MMELVTSREEIENGNVLAHNQICINLDDFKMIDSKIKFLGENNKIIFVGKPNSALVLKDTTITLKGNDNLIIINDSKYPISLNCILGHGCSVYLGRNFWSTNTLQIMANEMSNVYIGEWCLFARDIWIRTSDMHLIYDCDTKERINYNKDVYIGEHVWIGQDVFLGKGSVVGNGGIVGMRSMCNSNKLIEVNASYGGTPARILKRNIMWRHKGSNQITVDEVLDGTYDVWDNDKYIYDQDEMIKQYERFENIMFNNPNICEKEEYLLSL